MTAPYQLLPESKTTYEPVPEDAADVSLPCVDENGRLYFFRLPCVIPFDEIELIMEFEDFTPYGFSTHRGKIH